MAEVKKQIGFIISNITTQWAQEFWPLFVNKAREENKSLFIFPGGYVDSPFREDTLRNSVYSLVNNDNLDGSIIFSSSVIFAGSKEALERFHWNLDPLPYVTLDYKVPGHININFDSYTGMKQLITHCINTHGARKIAFLQGPSFNTSAMLRYQAYKDALQEAGLPFDPNSPLITSHFIWEEGDKAAAQLLEERQILPGRDFDTLIGSNDQMILMAIKYFKKHGYYVPRDYHALGFDNSLESSLTECPLSTVKFPYQELYTESFRMLNKLISGTEDANKNSDDVILPAEPVIRQSCGCKKTSYLPSAQLLQSSDSRSHEGKMKSLTKLITDFLRLKPREARIMVEPLVRSWSSIPAADSQSLFAMEVFFTRLERVMVWFMKANDDTEPIINLLNEISNSGLVSTDLFRKLEPAILRTILRIRGWLMVNKRNERDNINLVLNYLKYELLETMDIKPMIYCLARHLPKIGIHTAGLALYADDNISLWAGNFSPRGIGEVLEDNYFPRRLLVPEHLKECFSDGYFMVQPLFLENQSLGYFIHTISGSDGMIFEEIRSFISYALKSILLFDNAEKARLEILESNEQSRLLNIQKEAAQAASEAKSIFLAKVSHEIRTPMNAVLGMSELLLSEDLNQHQKQYAEDIKISAMGLLEIINEILDISQIQSGKTRLIPVHFNFKSMIDNFSSMIHSLIGGKNIVFKLSTSGEIPDYLFGDVVRLRQILINILSNAVKFTDDGYVQLTIDVTETQIHFKIKDTGRGVKQEDIPKLFQTFMQIDTEKNQYIRGTGLGLAITKSLAEMMNGRIEVESVYGQGTEFRVTIPKILGEKSKVQCSDPGARVLCSPDTKALVIDDNRINLNVISGLLLLSKIRISTATSGMQAIEILKKESFDIIFLDHMMPEMDGVETLKIIREMGLRLPVIALTANAVTDARKMLLEAGMDDFLPKPIIKDALNEILLKWIHTAHLINEHPVKAETEKSGDMLDKIGKIKNLSVSIGLEMVSGNIDIYKDSLKMLIKQIERCAEKLNSFLAAGDMKNFSIEAHSLKTSLANLGALDLSSKAQKLENSSARGDSGFCSEALLPFMDELQQLHDKLKEAFPAFHQYSHIIVPSELEEILTRMRDAIVNVKYEEINHELDNLEALNLNDELKDIVEEIKDAVLIMKYDQAAEKIEKLL